jgi:hypothetical protein
MSLAIPNLVDVGSPPAEPLCRSAKDPTKPCRFASSCHESRQRVAHYENIRGRRCWAFQQKAEKLLRATRHAPSMLICHHCGADYTALYNREIEQATWHTHRDWPTTRVCSACCRPASERRP